MTTDDCLPPFLVGLTTDQLNAFRAQLQQAIVALMSGSQVASANYAQGDGSKAIAYRQSDLAGMQMLIRYIDVALGNPCRRRRAIGVRF